MRSTISASFPSYTAYSEALKALDSSYLEAVPRPAIGIGRVEYSQNPVAELHSTRRHDWITRSGISGMAIGCATAFMAMGSIEGREIMYLGFLPIAGAYMGLGIGLLSGMGLASLFKVEQVRDASSQIRISDLFERPFVISVPVVNASEFEKAKQLLERHGAASISVSQSHSNENKDQRQAEACIVEEKLLKLTA